MSGERRKFTREGEERRRDALIAAALDLIAEGGAQAATVRAIAERAGVTPGLIRHYFHSKGDLTRAAYLNLMQRLTQGSFAAPDHATDTPEGRLAAVVAASLRPPVMTPGALGLWAGFIHQVQSDPAMTEVHEAGYLNYRDLLQALIATLPGVWTSDVLRQQAIACNGVIDGLWLEGCALPHAFAEDEIARIGVASVGAILGVDLLAHLPPVATKETDE